jgi:hypothetical protein
LNGAEIFTLRKIHQSTLKVLNLMLEKDGEDHFDRACEKRSFTYIQGANQHPT